jgi:hypothetical protein
MTTFWAYPYCANFLREQYGNVDADACLHPHWLEYMHFCTLNIYTVLG